MGKVLVIDLRHLQRLPQLPGGLQGRARGQRLVAHRQAAARHRPVLEQGERQRARPGAQGQGHLRAQHLPALRRRAVHRRPATSTPSTGATTASSSSTPTSAAATSCASRPARTRTSSTSTTRSTSPRSARSARTSWTRAGPSPAASDACPTGAFTFGDEDDPKIKELVAKAEPLKPELDVKPRVYYIGLPKKFIAGAVFDPEADECLEGATVTATNVEHRRQVYEAITDSYGDFWLKDLEDGSTPAHREVRLPGAEDGPRRRDHEGHERRRHRGVEGLTRRSGGRARLPQGGRALLFLRGVAEALRGGTGRAPATPRT